MIEHTRDFRRVKRLVEAYPPEGYKPLGVGIGSDIYYLIEGEDLGVWAFEPHQEGYLMHAAMGPDCRGQKALESGLCAIGWMFNNTDAETIIAATPVELKHTHVLPRYAGFRFVRVEDGMRCSVLTKEDFYRKAA